MLTRQTFEQLYRESEKPLFNIAYRWVWNRGEAQDLVQEAFLRVWTRRLLIDPERAYPYLVRTVVNLCQNVARRRRRWTRVRNTLGIVAEPQPQPDQDLQRHQLRQAMEKLSDAQRHALLLTEFTDMKHSEIAVLLGIPAGTVGSRRNSAIRQLRIKLND